MPEGRRWGDWRVDKANRCKIEAVLGLWMLHFKKLEKSKPSGTRSLRVPDIEKAAFSRWIRREAETVRANSSGRAGNETLRIVGNLSNIPTSERFVNCHIRNAIGSHLRSTITFGLHRWNCREDSGDYRRNCTGAR